jgi:sortase (surface protein transpeptidase)
MPTLSQKQQRNKKIMKKSWLFLLGSLLVIIGVVCLSFNHIKKLTADIYNDMLIKLSEEQMSTLEVPEIGNIDNEEIIKDPANEEGKKIDYSKYLGILEIPRISLKRGFYGVNSKYNNVEYNVAVNRASSMPNVKSGNLILMAHSGDAYISYFAYLYLLKVGDKVYVTYKGTKYTYKIVNIYNVKKFCI